MASVTPSAGGDALRVDPAALRHAAGRMDELADRLGEKAKAVARETEALVESWIGRSADRWGPEFKEWRSGNKDVVAELEAFADGLRAAASAYEETEGANEQGIVDAGARLNLDTDV